MLNEAYGISKSLQDAKVIPESQHPDITMTLGKGIYIRVYLNEEGHITHLYSCEDSDRLGFWTHTAGNGLWFPIVPMEIALFAISQEDEIRKSIANGKEKPIQRLEVVKQLQESYKPAVFTERQAKNIQSRLEQGKTLQGSLPEIDQLVTSFEQSISKNYFLPDLCAQTVRRVLEGVGDQETWTALFLGTKVRVVLDLSETIYKSSIRQRLVQALLQKESEGPQQQITSGICSLTGAVGPLQTGPFPKVPLSVLGKEYPLFSRFYASECNARYGKTGSDSMAVGRETALQLKDSMTWLLAEEHKGDTWQAVPSGRMDGKREKRDLLCVYVEGLPNIGVSLANYLAGNDEPMEEDSLPSEEEILVSRFTADTGIICDALEAKVHELPESRVQITLLRKASDGAAFVALSETPTVENLLNGARWWSEQGRNLPHLRLPLIPKVKGTRLDYAAPAVPAPAQAVSLFMREWRRSGVEFTPIGGVTLGEVLPLLFYPLHSERHEKLAHMLLSQLLPRVSTLLIGIGGAIHRRDDTWNAFGNPSRRFALRTLGFLGICLSALKREKGLYMNEAPYQVGQLLALADRLHRDYHLVVRTGPMPPNLIGNAHFSMALENPTKALAILASRIPVYIGWAKTAQVGDSTPENIRIPVFEAKKVLREYEVLAAAVHGHLPDQMKDIDKAEILLGYLAGAGKDEEKK